MIEELEQGEKIRRHKFSVADYFALSELGLLSEATELIEGDIYDMTAHSPRHRKCVNVVADAFKAVFNKRATIFAQSTLAFEGWSPEPDVMLLAYDPKQYGDRQPSTAETLLIVEVSDTTLAKDKGIKLRSYARQGIRDYWIVNLVENVVEVYRRPRGEEYGEKKTYGFGDAFAPLAFPEDARVWLEDL